MSQVGFRVFRDTRAVKEDENDPRIRLEALVDEKDQTDEGQGHATADHALERGYDRVRRGSIPSGLLVLSGHK